MFRVQKNVPIPPLVRNPANIKRTYPYHTMKVGDFFFAPNMSKNTLSSHASTTGHKMGRTFVTRLTYAYQDTKGDWKLCDEHHEGSVRGVGVWREK